MNVYAKNNAMMRERHVRVVSDLSRDLVERIDDWGVDAGMPNRVSTIRTLLSEGLKAVEAKQEGSAENANT